MYQDNAIPRMLKREYRFECTLFPGSYSRHLIKVSGNSINWQRALETPVVVAQYSHTCLLFSTFQKYFRLRIVVSLESNECVPKYFVNCANIAQLIKICQNCQQSNRARKMTAVHKRIETLRRAHGSCGHQRPSRAQLDLPRSQFRFGFLR